MTKELKMKRVLSEWCFVALTQNTNSSGDSTLVP